MAQNVEKNVSNIYQDLQYSYDRVSFNPGVPPLANELNDLQEFQEILTQKSTAGFPSGWLSYRPFYTSKDLSNSFYTQDPAEPKPEVALVNGWPIYVTNTNTSLRHVNQINLSDFELKSGSRVDGVFLEVWRSLITPQDSNVMAKPQNTSQISTVYSIEMFDESLGWAVGDKGTILKTVDGGDNWVTKDTPIAVKFNRVKFYNQSIGYAIAEKGYIIKTLNGGESWFVVSTTVNDNLNDLSIINQNTIIAVGDNGTILKTLDGTNFELILSTSGTTANLNGIFFYDDTIGWIVGDAGTLLITKDRGQTWQTQVILDTKASAIVTTDLTSVAFFNLNDGIVIGKDGTILKTSDSGYHFVGMSDMVWNSTTSTYNTLDQIYPNTSTDLNRIFIDEHFANNFSISLYGPSATLFSNASYNVTPDYFTLQFRSIADSVDHCKQFSLTQYPSAEALTKAVNSYSEVYDIRSGKMAQVFQMTASYATTIAGFVPTSGAISSSGTTTISFSIEDTAWIVGNDGLVLKTSNSGSRWDIIPNLLGFDLYDAAFVSDTLGWVSGSDGSILFYNPPNSFVAQNTDLPLKSKGRIYPEGNILSQAENFLDDDIIDPQVGVETSDRIQIQYSIRVATGIDPFTYPESGLGAEYINSLGPNDNNSDAGSYTFSNMGQENGDYGLWKAHCRNTYDGWVWAIPMFIVTRRNSSPFDPDTNINGSTDYSLNAIRPDELTYEEIDDSEITDLRKKINIQSYTALMEKNFDKLMGNRLRTKLSTRDEKGTQYGTSILLADTFIGTDPLNNLVSGLVTSEAALTEDVKELDPNNVTPLTTADFTFGPVVDGIYLTDPSYHIVRSKINGVETSKVIPGSFEGLGTNTLIFDIGQYSPDPGETYVMHAWRIDYTKDGLSQVPNEPLGVKYVPDVEDNSVFYRGINANVENQNIEYLTERVPGYQDYTDFYSAKNIGNNQDDIDLYQSTDNYVESSLDYTRSLTKFKGQQFKGSLLEYHYFLQTTDYINQLVIPKNINNYTVFNVKKVADANSGAAYLISTGYDNTSAPSTTLWSESPISGGSYDNSTITINIDPAFTIPKSAVVEVILEVVPSITPVSTTLGFTQTNIGPNIQAYRAPFTANFNVGSKGVDGLYKSALFVTPVTAASKSITVDLTNPGSNNDGSLTNGTILGISSFVTKEVTYQSYVWYSTDGLFFYAIPISSVENLGTSSVTIYFDNRVTITGGTIYVPMLVQQTQFTGATATSEAYVFYKFRPYQALDNLPTELTVEVLTSSDFLYVSNLGTGGSNKIKKDPYENPIDHIPVNDASFVNDNIFTNIDDLDFIDISVDTGLVKIPAFLSRKLGEDITLSKPNNIGDRLGRAFYTACDDTFKYQSEGLVHAVPRKVFFPVLARVRSDLISPVVRGEIVLIVFSKMFKARTENMSGMFEDDDTEYTPGYFESADTAIAVYRLLNYPTVRM
jgi:photosystem II stability/assembly factor-like uncharacterized protein